MPDEEAFCVLVRLMHSYGLRDMFLPEMPGLQLRLFQFDRLVEELLPVLHVHFVRQGVKSSMYCSQWFLTMFSYRFVSPVSPSSMGVSPDYLKNRHLQLPSRPRLPDIRQCIRSWRGGDIRIQFDSAHQERRDPPEAQVRQHP